MVFKEMKYFKCNWGEIDFKNEFEISENGDIRRISNGKILKSRINSKGYRTLTLSLRGSKISIRIHRAVISTYKDVGSVDRNQVNHEDGDKLNNHFSNLSWVTNKENIDHALENGLYKNSHENLIKGKNRKRVIGYIENKEIFRFASILDVSIALKIPNQNISDCCNKKRKSAGKHKGNKIVWRFE